MKPISHTIDIDVDGNVTLIFTYSDNTTSQHILTVDQAEMLANDLHEALTEP